MKIGLMLHPYDEQQASGLGRAAFELAQAAIGTAPQHQFIVCTKESANPPPFPGNNWELRPGKGGLFWQDAAVRSAPDVEIWVFFTPMMPFFTRPKKSVVIAHDFAYLRIGRSLTVRSRALQFLHARALKRASAVVTVSQFTKQDIVQHFAVAPQKISVIYDGINNICSGGEEPLALPSEPFFLYAGVFKERKNILQIVRGFKCAADAGFPDMLVLAGNCTGAYAQAVLKEIEGLDLANRVLFPGYITDAQLCFAYHHTLAFVYPTLVEGFGMAALDAMACGAPAILSKGTALQEAAGGAALLVDPKNPEEIGEVMLKIWRDQALRESLKEKGKKRASEFSWEKSGRELILLMEKL